MVAMRHVTAAADDIGGSAGDSAGGSRCCDGKLLMMVVKLLFKAGTRPKKVPKFGRKGW